MLISLKDRAFQRESYRLVSSDKITLLLQNVWKTEFESLDQICWLNFCRHFSNMASVYLPAYVGFLKVVVACL